jgi:hypothetical protein
LPGISQALRKLVETLDEEHVPNMLIGGYALPAYGRIRATQDVDIAIAASFSQVVKLHKRLVERGFQLPSSPNEQAPLFSVTDLKNKTEIEIWTRPDGVVFDDELLRRRVKVRPFDDDFEMFAIGPEDFIVNKLSRKDRGVQDEMDVVSVLKLQKDKLDYEYLTKRAKAVDIVGLLKVLRNEVP